MSESSHPDIPLWIQNRIIGFFNKARNVDMILDGSIKDDPSNGKGTTIGPALAARILREKNSLPRRRFTDFEQIDEIRGIGPDTVQDLVYSFGQPAAAFFKKVMYDSETIYKDNWALDYFRYQIEDQEAFTAIVEDKESLRSFVMKKVEEESKEKKVDQKEIKAMEKDLKEAYLDPYSNSTPEAAYAFALWFYQFDADNWFSWEQIQKQTKAYFDYNFNTYPWQMDFYLFRGFENRGLVEIGITPDALPVNVNWAEQCITIWGSALYD